MTIHSLSLFGFSFGVLLTAVLSIAKRRDLVAIRFGIFSISVCGWGFLTSLWISQSYSYEFSLMLAKASHVTAVFIPITWTHFVFEFLHKKEPLRYFYGICYAFSSLLMCLTFSDYFIKGMHPVLNFEYFTTPGPLYIFYPASFFILVPGAFYVLLKRVMYANGEEKSQLLLFVIATIAGFAVGSILFLPTYNIPFPLYFLPLMLSYPFIMGIALMKYGLFDAEAMADAFRRDKLMTMGMVASSINHEIRNPLYIIRSLSDSFLADWETKYLDNPQQASKEFHKVVAKTTEQAQRAMDMVKRFSSFAKNSVDQTTETQAVAVKTALENVLPLIGYELEHDNITVERLFPASLPKIRANPGQFEEVLFNLIVNAIQAIKPTEKPGKIEISAKEAGDKVEVLVKDDGPGIPKDRLHRIFEPFHTTKAEGTGLGLYITKQLVEKNGGRLEVTSQEGIGTAFTVHFKKAG